MDHIAITIKPTNACNMSCRHCYHSLEGFDTAILPIEQIYKILTMAACEYDRINVLIHGGEPTLCGNTYFKNIYDYEYELTKKYAVKFTNVIQTNGLLLNNELLQIFKDRKVVLGISFDGPNNDILRGNTDIVYSRFQMMKAMNMPLHALCVETSASIGNIIKTYNWFKQHEIDYKILPVFEVGNACNISELMLSADDYAYGMVELYKFWVYDKTCNIQVKTLEEFIKLFTINYTINYGGSCVNHRLALNSDAKIFPCGRPYPEEYYLGTLDEVDKLSDFFKKDNYLRLIKISEKRKKNCDSECKYSRICNGGCISNSILDGSLDKIYGNACQKSKKLYELIEPINMKIMEEISSGYHEPYNPTVLRLLKSIIPQ